MCLCAFCLKKAVPKMTYIVSLLTHPSPLYPSHHFVNICVTVNLASENCFRKILCFVLHRLISERECCNSFLTELQSVSRCMLLISYPVCEIFCICVVQMPTITACICYSCFCSVFFSVPLLCVCALPGKTVPCVGWDVKPTHSPTFVTVLNMSFIIGSFRFNNKLLTVSILSESFSDKGTLMLLRL